MDDGRGSARRPLGASELILLALACLTPWAFGAVESWSAAAVDLGVVSLAVLDVLGSRRSAGPSPGRSPLPGLALLGLAALGLVQAAPIPGTVARSATERVLGDPGPAVPPPGGGIGLVPEESINAACRLASVWIVFRAAARLGGGVAPLRRFGAAIAANAAALAVFSIVQGLTWNGKIYWLRPSPHPVDGAWSTGGPFVCHSHLAAYLNVGLGFALAFLSLPGRRGRGARLCAGYAVASIAVGIVASQSRSGLVAASGALAVALVLGKIRLRQAAAAGAVASFGALLLAMIPGGPIAGRVASIFDPASIGKSGRLEIWGLALRAWWGRPIWGWGLGSFGTAIAPLGRRDFGVVFSRAENEYLDLLVEGGAVGLGLAVAGLIGGAVLVRRALGRVAPGSDRALVVGAIFAPTALLIQSLGDFAIHIPAVALPATILAGYACGLGAGTPGPSRRGRSLASGLAVVAMAACVLARDAGLARAEAALMGSDLPMAGTSSPSPTDPVTPRAVLEHRLSALDLALRHRPDWAEGHLRRALTLSALYERAVADLIADSTGDTGRALALSGTLWLHRLMHPGGEGRAAPAADLLEHEPVRRFLVPSARGFLEARRCNPGLALPHAGLAGLDFLLEGGEPSATYAARALERSGSDHRVHLFLADVADQAGEPGLAARCWGRSLEAGVPAWEEVADRAGERLDPGTILRDVLPPGGRLPLLFADRLYAGPDDAGARERFLRAAVERMPAEVGLSAAGRDRLAAHAWARLDDRGRAVERMASAIAGEPTNAGWRREYAEWLIEWGLVREAHREAMAGLRIAPDDPALATVRGRAADALARGPSAPGPGR